MAAVGALLAGVLVPSIAGARQAGRVAGCLAGVRQIAGAAAEHAANDPAGRFMPVTSRSDDSLAWLTIFLPDVALDVARCPGTENEPSAHADLARMAPTRDSRTGGHSYDLLGATAPRPGARPVVKAAASLADPARTWLLIDRPDDAAAGTSTADLLPWPTERANHGPQGLSVAFADGNARWLYADDDLAPAAISAGEPLPADVRAQIHRAIDQHAAVPLP